MSPDREGAALAPPITGAGDPTHAHDWEDLARVDLATEADLLVLHGGQPIASSGGEAPAKRYCLYSISKMITAAAVLRLVSQRCISLDDRVAGILSKFGANGKGDIRISEVLSHSAGFPRLLTDDPKGHELRMTDFADWERAVALICTMPMQPEVRGRGVYHAFSFAILAAVVEELAGCSFTAFCKREIFEPLGMSSTTWGLPARLRVESAGFVGTGETPERARWREATLCPAANCWSTAADVAQLLLMLRGGGELEGTRVLDQCVVEEAVRLRVRAVDGMWGYGLGVMVDSTSAPVFARGHQTAPGTFGHSGATGTQAFHDPLNDVTFVCLTNSVTTQAASDARFDALVDAVYATCLAGTSAE